MLADWLPEEDNLASIWRQIDFQPHVALTVTA